MSSVAIQFFHDLPDMVQWGFISLLGLALGSFSTVLIHRIPRNVSWWRGAKRSRCPSCRMEIQVTHLFPLVSWIFLRGRCFFCGKRIPIIYPLVELSVMLSCLFVFYTLGISMHSILVMLCAPFLMAALAIDLKHMILPNQITAILLLLAFVDILWAVVSLYGGGSISIREMLTHHMVGERVIASIAYFAFALLLAQGMKKIMRREALGMGDVKFFSVVGLWLGLSSFSLFLILAGVLGVVFALLYGFIKKKQQRTFPFGPALIMALFILLLFDGSNFF